MGDAEREAEAFRILEENFSEEVRNGAYALVLDQVGRFIEKNKLRKTNFPQHANSALYTLALGLAKNNLVTKPAEAEKYLEEQLMSIRESGLNVVEKIFKETTA
ncbi:MAG: hypothetical protein QXU32_13010 [Nitrososphaerales archaeon]